MLDLIEYFDTFFAGVTSELRIDYWREAIELAPRLSGRDRARLWSVLWYDFQPFTDLYLTLDEGLQKLGFAPEALLGMDALIPREKSIVDVLTLDRLGADADDTLRVRPKRTDGISTADAQLPRSLVCALTAELNVAIDEKPWDFFDHTDLLDFPGARSRLKLANLEDVGKAKDVAEGANPLRELLLRGKVAYLFQRYSAERELSAILLCIPDGNQEVRDLSDMMGAWIDQTIGATSADRAKQKNALFLVLTKMDLEFEQKGGETEELRRAALAARINNRWSITSAASGPPTGTAGHSTTLSGCQSHRHRRAADGATRTAARKASPRRSPLRAVELRGSLRRQFRGPASFPRPGARLGRGLQGQ